MAGHMNKVLFISQSISAGNTAILDDGAFTCTVMTIFGSFVFTSRVYKIEIVLRKVFFDFIAGTLGCVFIDNGLHKSGVT